MAGSNSKSLCYRVLSVHFKAVQLACIRQMDDKATYDTDCFVQIAPTSCLRLLRTTCKMSYTCTIVGRENVNGDS